MLPAHLKRFATAAVASRKRAGIPYARCGHQRNALVHAQTGEVARSLRVALLAAPVDAKLLVVLEDLQEVKQHLGQLPLHYVRLVQQALQKNVPKLTLDLHSSHPSERCGQTRTTSREPVRLNPRQPKTSLETTSVVLLPGYPKSCITLGSQNATS